MINRTLTALRIMRTKKITWRMSWHRAKKLSPPWVEVFYLIIILACLSIALCLYQQATLPQF